MSIKDKFLDVIIPWRAPIRRLSERNDYLVSANNRLGITILAQRKEIGRLRPKKPKQKEMLSELPPAEIIIGPRIILICMV